MKRCPTCHRTYPDDTLAFCLVDGSILSAPYDPQETLQPRESPPSNSPLTEIMPNLESPKETATHVIPQAPPLSTIASPRPTVPMAPWIEDKSLAVEKRHIVKPRSRIAVILIGVGGFCSALLSAWCAWLTLVAFNVIVAEVRGSSRLPDGWVFLILLLVPLLSIFFGWVAWRCVQAVRRA